MFIYSVVRFTISVFICRCEGGGSATRRQETVPRGGRESSKWPDLEFSLPPLLIVTWMKLSLHFVEESNLQDLFPNNPRRKNLPHSFLGLGKLPLCKLRLFTSIQFQPLSYLAPETTWRFAPRVHSPGGGPCPLSPRLLRAVLGWRHTGRPGTSGSFAAYSSLPAVVRQ